MSNIDYSTKIPNNVNLADDRKIQRALEKWQPAFISWWNDFGPNWASNDDIFLRTAVSANTDGWAVFDYVKMPDLVIPRENQYGMKFQASIVQT
jgi:benzoyl-CoA 2,3-dioxygenase component B